jgi:hypothetical protein
MPKTKIKSSLFWSASLVLGIVLWGCSLEAGQSHEAASDSKAALVFSGTAEIRNCTVIFDGTAIMDDFFKNLTKSEESSGEVFKVGTAEVKLFPDRFRIRLIASGPVFFGQNRCNKLDNEAMKSIVFDAQWKRGTAVRPVKTFALEGDPISYKNGKMTAWVYILVFQDEDVPLSDHLILNVSVPGDKRVTRLSARL